MPNSTLSTGPIDTSKFVRISNVPILDTFTDKELNLDKDRLEQIVKVNSLREADTGDLSPLIIGHTDDNASETEQPEIVGYATNFKLGTIGNVNPRPAVYVDYLVPPENQDLLKKYPRRSVELYADNLVDPIALLGATTPRRSLGMLMQKPHRKLGAFLSKRNSRESSHRITFELPSEQLAMTDQELAKFVLDTMAASPMGQYIAKQMDSASVEPAPAEVPPAAAEKAEKAEKPADDKVRLERDSLAIKLNKQDAELVALRKDQESTAAKLRKTERETELKTLSYSGYLFDLVEELDYCEKLSADQYAAHLSKIKTRYQRNPIGGSPIPASSMVLGTTDLARKEKAERAAQYAKANKCSFAVAMEKVDAN